ncbi:hypothetical protein HQ576_03270 [bacterium]|nr:hypothetical protein [bacterium]
MNTRTKLRWILAVLCGLALVYAACVISFATWLRPDPPRPDWRYLYAALALSGIFWVFVIALLLKRRGRKATPPHSTHTHR